MKERIQHSEEFGVIFAIYKNHKIQLELPTDPNSKYFGFILVPGGKVEAGETYRAAVRREIPQKYDATPSELNEIGTIVEKENGITNFRHVFLVTKHDGRLKNPEHKSLHLSATLADARIMCKHPITQKVLDMVEQAELSRQNR